MTTGEGPTIVVGVALKDQGDTLARCLDSIRTQILKNYSLQVVILNDGSCDGWLSEHSVATAVAELNVLVLEANCGTAARSRNAILDFVDNELPACRWVARLDADDAFTSEGSLQALADAGDRAAAEYVLGGNRLVEAGRLIARTNYPTPSQLTPDAVVDWLKRMANGTATNELPSCNLVLRRGCGFRYPDIMSAEDHWLVANLLVNHPSFGTIVESPAYCDYTLAGPTTCSNRKANRHVEARRWLAQVANTWQVNRGAPGIHLGLGLEGIVCRVGDIVEKRFYPGALKKAHVTWLSEALKGVSPAIPEPEWRMEGESWICSYRWFEGQHPQKIGEAEARGFLLACLRSHIVCDNIKRSNFRQHEHGLTYIDIGNSVRPMHVDYFRDAAARLYGISVLGLEDDELRRRSRGKDVFTHLDELPGFAEFYAEVLTEFAYSGWQLAPAPFVPLRLPRAGDVTLLIKACPQDADVLEEQARHIVDQLEWPRRFYQRILTLDSFEGPYLRQFAEGSLNRLLMAADQLIKQGVIDKVITSPSKRAEVRQVNEAWFGISSNTTHNAQEIPVVPQLWAFDQVATRYTIQCDIDILIGREDLGHDYLQDMLDAIQEPDVLSIGFNIPQPKGVESTPYDAPLGEYVPEVRCGLLDLERLRACRPLPNKLKEGRLTLSWYRSVQRHQMEAGKRSLRGGDPRTFFVHPPNDWKKPGLPLAQARDLIGQARIPAVQRGRWDLSGRPQDWSYVRRAESIVVLAMGRNTPAEKVRRFVSSLVMQDDPEFGIIVIDDESCSTGQVLLPHLLKPLESRTTLVRHPHHVGRFPNFILGITELCEDPETLVVIVDLDDALLVPTAISRLREVANAGHDVILGAMFRPDKPTKCYKPSFERPRKEWGADVWIHLRSFQKKLFDQVSEDAFKVDGDWIAECTDYATMIPIVELASRPIYLPEYLYYHERTTPRTAETRARKDAVIRRILAKRQQ